MNEEAKWNKLTVLQKKEMTGKGEKEESNMTAVDVGWGVKETQTVKQKRSKWGGTEVMESKGERKGNFLKIGKKKRETMMRNGGETEWVFATWGERKKKCHCFSLNKQRSLMLAFFNCHPMRRTMMFVN